MYIIKKRGIKMAKVRTTAKQKSAARKNLVKARKKWKGMSSKSRKAAMPNPSRKKSAKKKKR